MCDDYDKRNSLLASQNLSSSTDTDSAIRQQGQPSYDEKVVGQMTTSQHQRLLWHGAHDLLTSACTQDTIQRAVLGHGFEFDLPGWSFAWTLDGFRQPLLRRSPRRSKDADLHGQHWSTASSDDPQVVLATGRHLSLEGVVWSTTDYAYLANVGSRCSKRSTNMLAQSARIFSVSQSRLHTVIRRARAPVVLGTNSSQITLIDTLLEQDCIQFRKSWRRHDTDEMMVARMHCGANARHTVISQSRYSFSVRMCVMYYRSNFNRCPILCTCV